MFDLGSRPTECCHSLSSTLFHMQVAASIIPYWYTVEITQLLVKSGDRRGHVTDPYLPIHKKAVVRVHVMQTYKGGVVIYLNSFFNL